jgi:predicted nucleic acid-binding protein
VSARAVPDASPLISFYQIQKLDIIQALFDELLVLRAVAREIFPLLGQLPSWMLEQTPDSVPVSLQVLDAGEREAIALALQVAANAIVLADRAARIQAKRLGLNVVGSAGLLVLARRRGFIEQVKPELDAMISHGLYMSEAIFQEVLQTVGEFTSQ